MIPVDDIERARLIVALWEMIHASDLSIAGERSDIQPTLERLIAALCKPKP